MLLKCDLVVLNRLTPGMENRKTHSTIVLAKEKKKDKSEIFFTVYTVKSKAGSKYKVRFFYTLVFFEYLFFLYVFLIPFLLLIITRYIMLIKIDFICQVQLIQLISSQFLFILRLTLKNFKQLK